MAQIKSPPYVIWDYSSIQLIAYQIPTNEVYGPGKLEKLPPQSEAFSEALKAIPDDDARIRVQRLAAVVDRARAGRTVDRSSRTLKIFMAPEFYFRPRKGAGTGENYYSRKTADNVVTALRSFFAHEDFKHWLFVPGTIVWRSEGFSDFYGHVVKKKDEDVVKNTALIIKGGHINAPFVTADKITYSEKDRIPNKLWPLKDMMGSRQQRVDSIKRIDGLWFGIEICLEHGNGILSQACNTRKKTDKLFLAHHGMLDIRLLTACGMNIEHFMAVKDGGGILGVDGDPGLKRHSEVQCVINPGEGLTVSTEEWNDLNKVERIENLSGLEVPGAEKVKDSYPQVLAFYKPVSFDELNKIAGGHKAPVRKGLSLEKQRSQRSLANLMLNSTKSTYSYPGKPT